MIRMRHCELDHSEYPTVVRGADSGVGCCVRGGGAVSGNSTFSAEFCCETKISLKN